MGIHTALDTNGYFGDQLTDAELETISLVLLDIKTWDPERHRSLTGMDNAPTLEFARRLAARRRPIWLRYVLVPGLTDDPEDVAKTAAFAAELGNVERVDVLPFHQMGRSSGRSSASSTRSTTPRRRRTNSSSRRVRSSGARA